MSTAVDLEEKFKATKLWNECVRDFRRFMPTRKHRRQLRLHCYKGKRVYDNTFTAQEAVTWMHTYLNNKIELAEKRNTISRTQALGLLCQFHERAFFSTINEADLPPGAIKDDKTLFRIDSSVSGDGQPHMCRFKNNINISCYSSTQSHTVHFELSSPSQMVRTPLALKNQRLARAASITTADVVNTKRDENSLDTNLLSTPKRSRSSSGVAPLAKFDENLPPMNLLDKPPTSGAPPKNTTNKYPVQPLTYRRLDYSPSSRLGASFRTTQNETSSVNGVKAASIRAARSASMSAADHQTEIMSCASTLSSTNTLAANPSQVNEVEYAPIWTSCTEKILSTALRVESVVDLIRDLTVMPADVQWNATRVNSFGVVSCRDKNDKLPKWIMGMMRCLTRWPFEHESAGFAMAYDHFELDVYKNVQRQFLERPPLLTPTFVKFLLAIVERVEQQINMEKERVAKSLSTSSIHGIRGKASIEYRSFLRPRRSIDSATANFDDVFMSPNGHTPPEIEYEDTSVFAKSQPATSLRGIGGFRVSDTEIPKMPDSEDVSPWAKYWSKRSDLVTNAIQQSPVVAHRPPPSANHLHPPHQQQRSMSTTQPPSTTTTTRSSATPPEANSIEDLPGLVRSPGFMRRLATASGRWRDRHAASDAMQQQQQQQQPRQLLQQQQQQQPRQLLQQQQQLSTDGNTATTRQRQRTQPMFSNWRVMDAKPKSPFRRFGSGRKSDTSVTTSAITRKPIIRRKVTPDFVSSDGTTSTDPLAGLPGYNTRTEGGFAASSVSDLARRRASETSKTDLLNAPTITVSSGNQRTERLVACLQPALLLLPTKTRHWLHYLLRFMRRVAANNCLKLVPNQPDYANRYKILEDFTECIVRRSVECPADVCVRLVSLLMDNEETIFHVPEMLVTEVTKKVAKSQQRINSMLMYSSQSSGSSSDSQRDHAYCDRISTAEFEAQKRSVQSEALRQLLSAILNDPKLSHKQRITQLNNFEREYPMIFMERFPCGMPATPDPKVATKRNSFRMTAIEKLKALRL